MKKGGLIENRQINAITKFSIIYTLKSEISTFVLILLFQPRDLGVGPLNTIYYYYYHYYYYWSVEYTKFSAEKNVFKDLMHVHVGGTVFSSCPVTHHLIIPLDNLTSNQNAVTERHKHSHTKN